jgi:hypothetical protein
LAACPTRSCARWRNLKKLYFQAAQKDSQARRAKIDERKRTSSVRWSGTIERNEAYESFSAAWLAGQITLGTLTAAKIIAAEFNGLSLGHITLALRIERHVVVGWRTARPSTRTGQITSDQQKQQENQQNEKE